MTKDSKLIFGVTSVVFGVLHWVLLLVLLVTAIYIPYVLIGGTVMFMLAGVPVGLAIYGAKRLFKWLNDEKWNDDS